MSEGKHTEAALRAAKVLYPNGTAHYMYSTRTENEAAKLRDQIEIAKEIDEATGLPLLLEALEAALQHVKAGYGLVDNLHTDTTGEQCVKLAESALQKSKGGV